MERRLSNKSVTSVLKRIQIKKYNYIWLVMQVFH